MKHRRGESRNAEKMAREEVITVDVVLRATGNVQSDKANGPQDIIVT